MAMLESGEMYLETIYILSMNSSCVRGIDISEYMGYSKPSVSRAVNLLKNDSLIETDKDGYIVLTQTGRAQAEQIYERHTVLSELLMDIGVDKETAVADACRVEHYISDTTFEAIKKFIKKFQPENKN